jgi:predicted FMN-binding regulatory protein PaiB
MFGLTDPDCLKQAISELVTWKLWTEELQGYVMVGWLEQNRSKQDVLETREGARKRMARWRRKSAAVRQKK